MQTPEALSALSDVGLISSLLNAWRNERGRQAAVSWRCEFARRRRDSEAWAHCVYAGSDGSLMYINALSGPDEANVAHPALGPLRIAEFPDDAALPGLAAVMTMLERVQIVRYRPGARCTLRGFVPQGERFVKVSPKGERLHDDAVKLWAAFKDSAFSVCVAEPHGWHGPTSSFWQGVVSGRPVAQDLFGADGERMARRIGVALGELASSDVKPSLTTRPAEHLLRTARAMARVEHVLPDLAPRLAQLRAALESLHAALPAERPLVPVHGSPHMHQWLVDGAQLGLIDFDRFALGEPEFDLATFLAELDTERRLQTPITAIEAALIEGFESRGRDIDAARLRHYRVYKHIATMGRRARAIRPDAAARAERHLRTVEAMIGQM